MSVDTKLFIAAKEEKFLEFMPKVIQALNKWQRNELKEYATQQGFNNPLQFLFRNEEKEINKNLKNFTNGVECESYDFKSFNINFIVHGENRHLFVTHSCSSDYSEIYEGDKTIFSLGCWGMSEEIMMVIAEPLKEYGGVYYDYNDCDDIDFKKL